MIPKSLDADLIKFFIPWIITISFILFSIMLYSYLIKQNIQYAFINNQLVFIDLETGHTIKGRLYNKRVITTPTHQILEMHA